jgi:hypothetical protein
MISPREPVIPVDGPTPAAQDQCGEFYITFFTAVAQKLMCGQTGSFDDDLRDDPDRNKPCVPEPRGTGAIRPEGLRRTVQRGPTTTFSVTALMIPS